MATFRRGKPVLVAVYVEKPRRKSLSLSRQNHHHHHHHLHIHQAKNGNRRAHLLEYSRKLRESARSQASTPLLHPSSHQQHSHQQPPLTQMVSIQKKSKHSATPTCLGNWKLLIPGFIRALLAPSKKKDKKTKKRTSSNGTTTKIRTIIKSFRVTKNRGFASKMFASLRKRH